MQLEINNRCFGCGADNPIGVKMRIEQQGDEAVSKMTVPEDFRGRANMAHGGFLCTVMDEVMSWALRGTIHGGAVTAQLNVRFLKPVMVGSEIVARGRALGRRRNLLRAEARVELKDGTVAARAEGLFAIVGERYGG